uniref:Surface presentation of antigens protein SpaK/InvB n=1 Tax=Erwinia amylovora ATCC BAA-2158 TaxID=889211 RepID=E5B2D1_ERWAM|nr:Surface presentation of antigens protein SpaK/InvB [Erwinia amylovora ATCC BAA-2158]
MKYDLVNLLSSILNDAGISEVMEQDLSNHSTITLNMKDEIPPIHIKNENDEVWVWAKLCDYNLSALSYCSVNLFPVMLNYNEDIFYAGQPCLYPVDGNLELRAQIREKNLESSGAFLTVLDHYLTILQEYRTVLA